MSNVLAFRRLSLRNWKNFARVDVDVQDRMFLVGPNASGKSNLLDAFRFLHDLASSGGGFEEAVNRRGGVSAIRCLAARQKSDVEIGVDLQEVDGDHRWRYELAFHQDNLRRPRVRKERVLRDDHVIIDRPDQEDRADIARLAQTHLEQVSANWKFRALATFFVSIRYLHIVPQLVREPGRSVRRLNDPFGGDFLEQIARTSKRTREARLKRIQKALRVAVPQLEEVALVRDAIGTPHIRGKYQHWRPRGTWQTEEQFSDGTLRLMGLLWAVMKGKGPLLLEEPELSLHPGIVEVLPQMFARAQRQSGRQIFLSTHSAELLRDEGIGLDEVLLFLPGEEGTDIAPAASLGEVDRLLEGELTLWDIVDLRTQPRRAMQLTRFVDT